jgi:hypothetical protein
MPDHSARSRDHQISAMTTQVTSKTTGPDDNLNVNSNDNLDDNTR